MLCILCSAAQVSASLSELQFRGSGFLCPSVFLSVQVCVKFPEWLLCVMVFFRVLSDVVVCVDDFVRGILGRLFAACDFFGGNAGFFSAGG